MSSDYNKPAGTSTKASFPQEIRDNVSDSVIMFDGDPTTANLPVNAKRIDNSDKQVYNWNGSSWDSIGYLSPTADPVGDIVDGAPVTLDTLNEIAAAIADDENFASTVVLKANNLSDLSNLATARTNLNVYSKSETDTEISNALGSAGGRVRQLYVGVSASGDGSGSNASNRMSGNNFRDNELGSNDKIFWINIERGNYSNLFTINSDNKIFCQIESGAGGVSFGQAAFTNCDLTIDDLGTGNLTFDYLQFDRNCRAVIKSGGNFTVTSGPTFIRGNSQIWIDSDFDQYTGVGVSTYEVSEGSKLTVNGGLTINGLDTMLIEDGAGLYCTDIAIAANGTLTITDGSKCVVENDITGAGNIDIDRMSFLKVFGDLNNSGTNTVDDMSMVVYTDNSGSSFNPDPNSQVVDI